MLPTGSELRTSNRESSLTARHLSALVIGIYTLPVDIPLPESQADELNVLADTQHRGAYSAD